MVTQRVHIYNQNSILGPNSLIVVYMDPLGYRRRHYRMESIYGTHFASPPATEVGEGSSLWRAASTAASGRSE